MASRIEPDPRHKPAAPPPAAQQSAAAPARPAAPPPKPAPQPAAAAQGGAEAAQEEEQEEQGVVPAGFLKQMPAWAISMLVHVIALLAMALIYTPAPDKQVARVITSTPSDSDEEPSDEPAEEPQTEDTQQTDATAMAVTTDAPMVEDVQVVTQSDAVEASVDVEFSDFSSETAAAGDMMAAMGAASSGFAQRSNTGATARKEGGGDDTEAAVEAALKWFIRHQLPDGSWSFNLAECQDCGGKCTGSGNCQDRAGATAMALLPFLGKGYTHKDGPYKKQVERGIAYLAARSLQQNGVMYMPKSGHSSFYVQGLASIALCECYGMTQDDRIAKPAQLSLNHIMDAQDPNGGGWRYKPREPGDTSVHGWQIMALKSGHMAYLKVKPDTIKNASRFLDSVQSDYGSAYGYMNAERPTDQLSAVALLCRMYLGWKKDNPALQEGVLRLVKKGPTDSIYHDYYATQIMRHIEGDAWIAWNNKMKPMLLSTQAKKDKGHAEGSWLEGVNGGKPYTIESGGRLYCTSLATLILEVYYRHLPMYRNQSVEQEFEE